MLSMGFPIVFIVAGAIVSALGVIVTLRQRHLTQHGVRTSGTVTRIVEHTSPGQATMVAPEFSFRTSDGKDLTIENAIRTNTCSFVAGQQIKVLYDPDNPHEAEIDTFTQVWRLPLLFGLLGPGMIVAGVFMLIQAR